MAATVTASAPPNRKTEHTGHVETTMQPLVDEKGKPLPIRPESKEHPGMAWTTDIATAELWQNAGGSLVSVINVLPAHPIMRKNRYTFRETIQELEAMVKRMKEGSA